MALYRVYESSVFVQYKTTVCSKAMIFTVISTFLSLIIPLILAYRSRGLWLKSYSYHEQPDVKFKYKYLLLLEAADDTEFFILCTNFPESSHLLKNENDCYSIKVNEYDYNEDKRFDEYQFIFLINNSERRKIISMKVFLIFEYNIKDTCLLIMECMMMLDKSFSMPISKYFVSGNMKFSQSHSLPCWPYHKDTKYNYTVIPDIKETSSDNYFHDLIYDYSRRNISTTFDNLYSTTKHGISKDIEIKLSIAIPENKIRYKPGFLQEIKAFWIQYFSIYIIFYWILNKIKSYVFNTNLIPAWKVIPWKCKVI